MPTISQVQLNVLQKNVNDLTEKTVQLKKDADDLEENLDIYKKELSVAREDIARLKSIKASNQDVEIAVNENTFYDVLNAGYNNAQIGVGSIKKLVDNSGTDIFHSHDAEVGVDVDTWTKIKTITLNKLPSSSLKIYFELKRSVVGYTAYGQIYKNGVAVGTARITNSSTYESYTETISGWSDGDTLELYLKVEPTGTLASYAQNFRIIGTVSEIDISTVFENS